MNSKDYAELLLWVVAITGITGIFFFQSKKPLDLSNYMVLGDCISFQYSDEMKTKNGWKFIGTEKEIPEVCKPVREERLKREKESRKKLDEIKARCLEKYISGENEKTECIFIDL